MNLDTSAYRYSLNVGSVSRFPPAEGSGSGAATLLAAGVEDVDPSRASLASTSSKGSSRLSSRYMAEEVAPQRRPVYLALPSDPAAKGVWSTNTPSGASGANGKGGAQEGKKGESGGKGGDKRRNSKIMTSFPFPHPITPRRRAEQEGGGVREGLHNLNSAWQRLLTAIFAGPYERQLNREEQEDDAITQSIIDEIASRNSVGGIRQDAAARDVAQADRRNPPAAVAAGGYGTFSRTNTISTDASEDPADPYGYRRLAGPHLLPSYTTDLVARRRERRRARARARFQCMTMWTIWTTAIVCAVIVAVLVFSFYFPDRLNIPHGGDGDDDVEDEGMALRAGLWLGTALMANTRPL